MRHRSAIGHKRSSTDSCPSVLAYRITIPEAREDEAIGVLWELGTHGVQVQRAPDGEAALLAYFSEALSVERLRARLAGLSARVEPVRVPDVDWVSRFRETFRSFPVCSFLVAPPWDVPQPVAGDARVLIVDPGRAFGTGTHETTRLCLAEIERLFEARKPSRVLDIGTGTGILAIAAARLGAGLVVGSDYDPEALLSARHHASLNQVPLALVEGDGGAAFQPRSFDLVLANLSAPLLRAHAPGLAGLVAPAGTLVLSGLLAEEAASVRDAYAALGTPIERRDGEWSALTFSLP
ncbi:MAG TPA: 50S ribosomal protein L11 methyltransferase [Vicinamibacteria bacterium]|nr:50S ribosomal protein L11 methyltransferase [Vicinamibacteria bacterium]